MKVACGWPPLGWIQGKLGPSLDPMRDTEAQLPSLGMGAELLEALPKTVAD